MAELWAGILPAPRVTNQKRRLVAIEKQLRKANELSFMQYNQLDLHSENMGSTVGVLERGKYHGESSALNRLKITSLKTRQPWISTQVHTAPLKV